VDREALRQARDHLEEQVQERTAELSQSIAQLAEAQQLNHMGHWEWDLEHDRMTWSDEIYRILGYSPQCFPAQYDRLLQAIHPDDREVLTVAIDKVLLDRASFNLDYRIVQPSGVGRIVHQETRVSFDNQGKLLSILGTIQDITERKEMEVQLQLAANVFENAGEGILITDADNNIVDVNDAFTAITGFRREDVLGQNPRLFKSGKHDPSFYREMWNALKETGQWQGELWGKRKSGAIFPKWQTINMVRDRNGRASSYIAIFRDISDAKKNEEQLWKLAHFDNLTGVANRSLMYTNLRLALAQAKQENLQVAMMLFDLDGFKQINDTMGHDAGDQLLKHVARQLTETVRDVDTVARLGGDEFTVILTGIHKPEDVSHVAKKIQAALAQPLSIKPGQEIIARASIGIALYPADAVDIETLMKNADRAMYRAKELGKNNFQFFTEGMSEETKPESPTA
jgi:diguanylate cyclase (GGDEF)-like protein/PAS domain S-box-containing protein